MRKTLIINAHPKVDSEDSLSLKVYQHFLNCYKNTRFINEVEQIDVYKDDVPVINRVFLHAWQKFEKGSELDPHEQNILGRMEDILLQFKSAKRFVIVMPLHNWNIPSKLKDYMDNIMIPRETFKYREDGSIEGLLTGDRSVLVIQASDGIYTNNDWNTELEFSHKYLKSMFGLIGIDKYQIIRAQGKAFLSQKEILTNAYKEAELVAEDWIAEERHSRINN